LAVHHNGYLGLLINDKSVHVVATFPAASDCAHAASPPAPLFWKKKHPPPTRRFGSAHHVHASFWQPLLVIAAPYNTPAPCSRSFPEVQLAIGHARGIEVTSQPSSAPSDDLQILPPAATRNSSLSCGANSTRTPALRDRPPRQVAASQAALKCQIWFRSGSHRLCRPALALDHYVVNPSEAPYPAAATPAGPPATDHQS